MSEKRSSDDRFGAVVSNSDKNLKLTVLAPPPPPHCPDSADSVSKVARIGVGVPQDMCVGGRATYRMQELIYIYVHRRDCRCGRDLLSAIFVTFFIP